MSLPEIEFRPISKEYLEVIRGWRNDPRVFKWCRQYEKISYTQHIMWFHSLADKKDLKMYEVWHDDGLYGVAGLTSIDWVNRRAEFSLYINPDCQSKGFGEAALRHLLKHGFEVLNLNLIWGESFDGNPAMRLFSRVGMRPMGVRRQFYFRDGKYLDAYLWDITKAEFEGKHDPSNINHLTSGINCRFEHGLGIKAEEKKTKGTPDDPPPGIGA